MKRVILFIILILNFLSFFNVKTYCKKEDQSYIALNVLKYQIMSLQFSKYQKEIEANNFKQAKYSSMYLQQYYFSINSSCLIKIRHKYENSFLIFALLYPSLHPTSVMVAVDNDGLYYYLNGFNTDHFNKLFENNKIIYKPTNKFANDIIDLYSKTVILKYNLIEDLINKSIIINKTGNNLDVVFKTKSEYSDEYYQYKVELSKFGLKLIYRKKVN